VTALALCALLAAAAAAPPAPDDDWQVGAELVGLWGAGLRGGFHGHRGPLDFVGLRTGLMAGPSPIFARERTLAATWVALAVDLFPATPWQAEITLGEALLEHDDHGEALVDWNGAGAVLGIAGRYRTDGPFAINLGLLLIADDGFRDKLLVIDIAPGWVW